MSHRQKKSVTDSRVMELAQQAIYEIANENLIPRFLLLIFFLASDYYQIRIPHSAKYIEHMEYFHHTLGDVSCRNYTQDLQHFSF